MVSFTCHLCGEVHDEIPDLGFSAPDYWRETKESPPSEFLTTETCLTDGNYFIRGCLEIPITDHNEVFAYGIWMSVSQSNFTRYQHHLDDNSRNLEDRYVGYISNSLPGFDGTLDLVAAAQVRKYLRPTIELDPIDHPLVELQKNGLSIDQLAELVSEYLH